MIKKFILITMICFFLLASCMDETPKKAVFDVNTISDLDATYRITLTTQCPTQIRNNQLYLIITGTFLHGNIDVQYPQIHGLRDDFREKAINDLIKNDLPETQVKKSIDYYKGDDKMDDKMDILALDLKYQVTMHTEEILSVLYTGQAKLEGGAFSTSAVYAITIDLKNVTKLKLTDFTSIDSNLVEKIKQSTNVTNDAVKNGMDKKHLIAGVQNKNDQYIIDGLSEEWGYYTFCVTPNSLIVSIAISHAAGDYALIEIQVIT